MTRIGKRQCRHCFIFFIPDHRNANRQDYCGLPECRKASKTASQSKWIAKNPDYFKGSTHVERVREWRRANPGRCRNKAASSVLQDDCQQQTTQKQAVAKQSPPATESSAPVLQDFCLTQHPVFIGLISHLLGCVLQDDIAVTLRRLEQWGLDIFSGSTTTKGGHYDSQNPYLSRPHPHCSRTVQLGGSPSGP